MAAEWSEQVAEAKTLEALPQLVRRAIAYSNTQSYHRSIGCQMPAQFAQQFLDRLTLESP